MIKVRKSLGSINVGVKIIRNRNIVAQMPLHPSITNWPYDAADYKITCDDTEKEYILHLKGDKEATKRMYESASKMDLCYKATAGCVETYAIQQGDAAFPISMDFELYAEPKPRVPKSISIRNGNKKGDIFVEYPKLQGAAGYVSKIAEVIEDQNPVYVFAEACSITFMVIRETKPNTKYLIILAAMYASGTSPFSDPITFKTAEWLNQ